MKYSRSWNIMKRLDLREPGKAEKLKHNQAREMDLVGENEALEELEKRWLMAGNERDWLYDGVKILFPLAPPRQPLLTLNPPPPRWPRHLCLKLHFRFFFPKHSISQEDVWLFPLAALQIKRSSPPCSWRISAEMHSCVFSSLLKSVFLPLCPSNQGWARKDCLNTLRRDEFWKKIKVLSKRKGRVLLFSCKDFFFFLLGNEKKMGFENRAARYMARRLYWYRSKAVFTPCRNICRARFYWSAKVLMLIPPFRIAIDQLHWEKM